MTLTPSPRFLSWRVFRFYSSFIMVLLRYFKFVVKILRRPCDRFPRRSPSSWTPPAAGTCRRSSSTGSRRNYDPFRKRAYDWMCVEPTPSGKLCAAPGIVKCISKATRGGDSSSAEGPTKAHFRRLAQHAPPRVPKCPFFLDRSPRCSSPFPLSIFSNSCSSPRVRVRAVLSFRAPSRHHLGLSSRALVP